MSADVPVGVLLQEAKGGEVKGIRPEADEQIQSCFARTEPQTNAFKRVRILLFMHFNRTRLQPRLLHALPTFALPTLKSSSRSCLLDLVPGTTPLLRLLLPPSFLQQAHRRRLRLHSRQPNEQVRPFSALPSLLLHQTHA